MARIFAIVINSEPDGNDKFEILNTNFLPEQNTTVILKQKNQLIRASVVKVESVLERVGDSADIIFNIFIRILPPEENVN